MCPIRSFLLLLQPGPRLEPYLYPPPQPVEHQPSLVAQLVKASDC
ncbi:hypothetical protein VDGL01_03497 [Verticillium dahliae]